MHCAVESYGLVFLSPPYDFECSEGHNERTDVCSWSTAFDGGSREGCSWW